MPSAKTARNPDIAVVGAGIVGLWTALLAARQGLGVVLIEKRSVGGGASGGPMGALMPHQPNNWSAKKQFQLDGLLTLPDMIAEVEDITGLSAGYRRCGRLMPIRIERKRATAEQWASASQANWPAPFGWQVLDRTADPGWLPPSAMPFGCNADTLSARVDPRALVATLAAAAKRLGVEIRENATVERIEPEGGLRLSGDERIAPGACVLAAGWESFGLIAGPGPAGFGVKGQAALLRPVRPVDPSVPILYDGGVYVIAHDNGLIAVGSTSETDFAEPRATDDRLDTVIAAAKALCPDLEDADVVERWAGVRPRAEGRDPLVGPAPGFAGLFVATGGFKISFAVAHMMARAALMQTRGETPGFLPDAFLPETRLSRPGQS